MSRTIKKRNYIRVGKLLVVYSILACGFQFTNHAYSQNIEKWIELSPMPTPRSELSATASEGFIYVGGGLNEVGGLDAFEIYDIENDLWSSAKKLPQRRHHTAMASIGNFVYITGGYLTGFDQGLEDLRRYDIETNKWKRLANAPSVRVAHSMVSSLGRLYVVGGLSSDPHSVWSYNPTSDSWNKNLQRMPTAREHATAVTLGRKIYVIGGRWSQVNLSIVEIYDPITNTWSRGSPMPTPSSGLTAAVVNGKIHVTGGEDLDSSLTFSSHYAYDPETNSWETLPPLPVGRHGLASAGVNGVFYVIGGSTLAGRGTYSSLTNYIHQYKVN